MTDNHSSTSPQENRRPISLTRSISRMAIGGIMLGLEVITGSQQAEDEPVTSVQLVQTDEDQVFYDILPDSSDVGLNRRPTPRKRSDQSLPYVMTGVLLDTSRRVGQIIHTFDIMTGRVGRTVEPIISPLINNPIIRPFKNGFDGLVRRGEGQVDHWKQLGMDEDQQGRELIKTITFSTIDTSIDYVAQQPEVYELATSRTKSFASVILDYIRSILVSLDIILLGIFAKVFRLSYLLKPEPPSEEIRKGATWNILASDEILDSEEHQDNTYFGYFAGFINRISAKFLDLFIVSIMLNIGIWFIRNSAVLLNAFRTDINFFDLDLTQPIIISIIGAAMFVFYNALLWTLFGSTFGQALLGIRVLKKDGSLPGPIRSFLRATLGITIAVTIFILTFFFIVFDKRRRGIHDRLFGTVVVYTWDARPSQRFMEGYVDKVFELRNELDSK